MASLGERVRGRIGIGEWTPVEAAGDRAEEAGWMSREGVRVGSAKEHGMRVVALGSGSGGNALLVEAESTRVLVDAGLPPRTLAGRLRQVGVAPGTLAAILLTHEHSDHARGAADLARQHQVPLMADARTLRAILAAPREEIARAPECDDLSVGRGRQIGTIEVRSFATSHDAVAPCGYLLRAGAWSVCVATDTGEVGAPMKEALREARLLVIEANHDRDRLLAGPYPWHLKRRILSTTGHLSNAQTAEALSGVLDGSPRWIWLAHLSRTNNTPDLAHTAVSHYLGVQGRLGNTEVRVLPPEMGPIWESPRSMEPGLDQPTLWATLAASAAVKVAADAMDALDALAAGALASAADVDVVDAASNEEATGDADARTTTRRTAAIRTAAARAMGTRRRG